MTKRYEVVMYWSEPDDRFIAQVPELPGCMADGKTYDECMKQVRDVMREWIDYARD